jgi:hypothetical protein
MGTWTFKPMKIAIGLTATVLTTALFPLAWGQPGEILINMGPKAGVRVKVTKKDATPDLELVSRSQTNGGAIINMGGTKSDVQVRLAAYRHEVVMLGSDGKERHTALKEFEVLSATNKPFRWSSWVNSGAHPRDFAVFTTDHGKTYVCHTGLGVSIYRVSGSKDSEVSFREYWEHVPEEKPDALKLLNMGLLFEHFGEDLFQSKNALYYDVFVDNIFEVGGELRVTLHGNKPEPKCTFALRSGRWDLVSTPGK